MMDNDPAIDLQKRNYRVKHIVCCWTCVHSKVIGRPGNVHCLYEPGMFDIGTDVSACGICDKYEIERKRVKRSRKLLDICGNGLGTSKNNSNVVKEHRTLSPFTPQEKEIARRATLEQEAKIIGNLPSIAKWR